MTKKGTQREKNNEKTKKPKARTENRLPTHEGIKIKQIFAPVSGDERHSAYGRGKSLLVLSVLRNSPKEGFVFLSSPLTSSAAMSLTWGSGWVFFCAPHDDVLPGSGRGCWNVVVVVVSLVCMQALPLLLLWLLMLLLRLLMLWMLLLLLLLLVHETIVFRGVPRFREEAMRRGGFNIAIWRFHELYDVAQHGLVGWVRLAQVGLSDLPRSEWISEHARTLAGSGLGSAQSQVDGS